MYRHQDPMGPDHQSNMLGAEHHQSTQLRELCIQHRHRLALRNRDSTADALALTRQPPHKGNPHVHSRSWPLRMHRGSYQGLVHQQLRQERRLPVGLAQHHHLVRSRAERRDHGGQSAMPQAALQDSTGQHVRTRHWRIKQRSASLAEELARTA